ncbi:GGDEF domain-containing protein [Lacticaseibacillus hulanensis]|uniref:GGDEF domain-containing protein n=1 Tax=Lacticaseibacillus hulanensis TaxID=2493111 RepID=UPI000FD82F4D|nr:GGDEF domain-containing protein [Lacticaseibacillus hulanensis]
MHYGWLTLSFIFSMVTNIIVYFGVLSLIYWVGEKKDGLLRRRHDQIQIAICWAFVAYLFIMSTLDAHFAPTFFGSHWTYFNLLIISSFIFNLLMVSWTHFFGATIATIGYMFWMPGPITPVRLGIMALVIGVQALLTWQGTKLWRQRPLMYGLMAVYGFICLVNMGIGAAPKDGWFWLRQISALVVEFSAVYEYSLMLIRLRQSSDRFRNDAERDRMTGLKNFGSFNKDLTQLYAKNRERGVKYWLMELDVDHFKSINDTYGHLVGNKVLKGVATATRAYADTLDYVTTVYRMGGEEFCLLLQGGTDNDERATRIALDLREQLRALHFTDEDGKTFQITVSIGVERVLAEDKNYLDIYNRVDKFLYDAKQSGRDAANIRGITVR